MMTHRMTHDLLCTAIASLAVGLAACSGSPERPAETAETVADSATSSANATDAEGTAGDTADTTAADPADGTTEGSGSPPSGNRVLMYVAYNNTWWPEYKVMLEGLRAAGYEVDVRSSTVDAIARSYGDRVDEPTPGVPGADPIPYEAFTAQFEASFGVPWQPQWNEPGTIALDGRIQDANMADYAALVFPGGSGSQFSRYDGQYEDLPSPDDPAHVSPAADIASAAVAINELVVAALVQGSPVLAVCHAGPTPGFARIPGTEGSGPDGLGRSLLEGRQATGFPLEIEIFGAAGDVAEQYQALGIEFLPEQAVVVDGPGVDLDGDGRPDGAGLVVTGRSWYPEEVAEGLRVMLDVLEP